MNKETAEQILINEISNLSSTDSEPTDKNTLYEAEKIRGFPQPKKKAKLPQPKKNTNTQDKFSNLFKPNSVARASIVKALATPPLVIHCLLPEIR